tara:strand:- start:81 stop:227 length:147 start_codon:yes stop_codon:yes gene_type:complete
VIEILIPTILSPIAIMAYNFGVSKLNKGNLFSTKISLNEFSEIEVIYL